MTIKKIVEAVLDGVEFTEPVDLEDVRHVHEAIATRLPKEARLESYHRIKDVVFEVRVGRDTVLRRVKSVLKEVPCLSG